MRCERQVERCYRCGPARGGAGIAVTRNAAPLPGLIRSKHGSEPVMEHLRQLNERVEQNLRLTELTSIAPLHDVGRLRRTRCTSWQKATVPAASSIR